jgi:hypothetical protein
VSWREKRRDVRISMGVISIYLFQFVCVLLYAYEWKFCEEYALLAKNAHQISTDALEDFTQI